MILKKWEELPEDIKNKETYVYYEILRKKKTSLILKRTFDIILSLILMIILLPISIILAICIKIDSKGPIFYRQERITQYGKIFKIFKFRTMIFNADKIGESITLENDSRITRVGNLIRKIRMDEIPQLINIFKGDMTFVGVRPEVKKYVDRYTNEMKATLLMPAGLTSTASVKFKNEDEIMQKYVVSEKEYIKVGANSSFNMKKSQLNTIDDIYIEKILPKKMKYNLEYISNFNILEDIKVCINTVIQVFGK